MIRIPALRAVALCLLATPALADLDTALDGHVLPRLDALVASTAALAHVAATCDPNATRTAWIDAFAAWAAAQHLALGPGEVDGRWQAIAFWPDDRDATGRGLSRLLASDDLSPEAIARGSVAARGLMALERLLWEVDPPCPTTLALAGDLAMTTADVRAGWDGFSAEMRNAGSSDSRRFLSTDEAEAALFTALMGGLSHTAEKRLGRPLGSFDRPRPGMAEARRSGQSQAAIVTALTSLRELAATLAPAPRTDAALATALDSAETLGEPDLGGVANSARRIRIEALRTDVETAIRYAAEEIGTALDVTIGFNSADGD